MLDIQRLRTLSKIALPIIGGSLSTNLLTVVDTAMVGRLDKISLAAVGLGGFAAGIPIALISGLSVGVQAIAARRQGEGKEGETGLSPTVGIMLAFKVGVPLTLGFALAAPWLLALLNNDPEVVAIGAPYFQAVLIGLPAAALTGSIRGYWSGVRRMRHYLWTIVATHIFNAIFNYALIFGQLGAPELGAVGAGVGSALASWAGAALTFACAYRQDRPYGFLSGWRDQTLQRKVWRISYPAGLRAVSQSLSGLALIVIIGLVGTAELAASSVIVRLVMLTTLPALGLGMACATMVGRALGKGEPDQAEQWGWEVVKVAALVLAVLGLPLAFAPDLVLMIFVTEPAVIELSRGPLLVCGFNRPLAAAYILLFALNGAGDTKRATLGSATLQWLVYLPGVWLALIVLELPFVATFYVLTLFLILQFVVFAIMWRGGRWRDTVV